jgi:hypothetical protein
MHDDKEKSNFEKTIEAVKDLATKASEAVRDAMKPESITSGDQIIPMPMAAPGFIGEAVLPPFVIVRGKKKTSRKTTSKRAAKTSGKKVAKKSAKSAVRKSKKKVAKKPTKKSKARSATKKKKAKKPKR